MDASTLWWVAAGVLVALELASGTFYLLMLALGAAAGAVAAHLGLTQSAQMALAAVVGALAAGLWYLKQRNAKSKPQALGNQTDPDLSLDLGQVVTVTAWGPDGSTHVSYRGAPWAARLKSPALGATPEPGPYRICGMQGNNLLLEKA